MDPFAAIRSSYEAERPSPGLAYRDPAVYDAEAARLFRTGWISIACGQNVPKAGDLLPVRIAGQSLLIARGEDGSVRVFYNMCRHRGARLVDAACRARAHRFVCPYHGWAFGTDGQLKAAPYLEKRKGHLPADPVERERLSLIPVRSAEWRDIIFVDLSGEAPAFDDFIAPLAQRIANWTESELRPLSSDEYEIRANWKLAAENFLDIYHLPVLHSASGSSFGGALATRDLEIAPDIIGFVMTEGYGPDVEADETLPRFPELRGKQCETLELFVIFPNTLIIVEPDCAQVIVLRPQSAELTEETFADYVVSDAALTDALAGEREELRAESLRINDEDQELLAGLQLTRSMDVGGDTQPDAVWDVTPQRFQRLWARKLLADT